MERTLSHYRLEQEIGRGGMGVVYAAVDTRLGRRLAIKLLPSDAVADPERRRRFMQEARAASALNHPNIAQVFDLLELPPEGGNLSVIGIAMELVDGTPLDRLIANGPLPAATALDYAAQIASALEAAHAAGIVHRDIKPANVIVSRDGRVKVLDFGLAKLIEPTGAADVTVTSAATRAGLIMGTAAYMSPEQAEGKPVDARSDLFSLGGVLYEMLAGRRPFTGDSELGVISSILRDPPPPLTGVPRDVAAIVERALQKPPGARYQTAAALRADVMAAIARRSTRVESFWRRPSVLAPAALALVAIVAVGAWQTVQARGVRWARTEAIPGMERAQLTTHTMEAVRLARVAEKYVPEDVARARQGWLRFKVATEPQGAEVQVKNYADVNGTWETFGASPAAMILPLANYRFRFTKPGYAPLEVSSGPTNVNVLITLPPLTGPHEGMVAVDGGDYRYGLASPVRLEPYWIDRLEVTNAQYKTFVDAGGYKDPKYWRELFVYEGRPLPFAEAMARFRDATGRSGPATWELGRFPEGQDDYPVGGLSWFEASAYAVFAGKRLPTVRHWFKAAGVDEIYSDILALSNFDGKGPSRAGERSGISPSGALDMAGNVNEWCTNAATGGTRRYILGGAWNEPRYRFTATDAREPWERDATFGVRLIENTATLPEADAPIGRVNPDPKTVVPAGDAEFELYKRFYSYDRTPLDSRVTAVDDTSPDWRKETLSFAAAYGGERVPAYFFTPKHAAPPFQTIVLFPSGFARATASSAYLDITTFDYLMKSGRAVLYPVYQGTFERRSSVTAGPNGLRDMHVQWAKDFFRAVDFLETRPDVDRSRLGYYSVSMGAYFGPIPVSLDARMKAAVFALGGLRYNYPAETQPANFMPHVTVPTLLINGRDDFSATPAAQLRFLELLGTPSGRKKHVTLDGGHVPSDQRLLIREVLDWYDKYLGPIALR